MKASLDIVTAYPPLNVLKPVADNVWVVDSEPLRVMGPSV